MITEAEIARINALYRKQQSEGLTPEEKEEQTFLRNKFRASIRASLTGQLEKTDVEYPDGTIKPLTVAGRKKKS
jgi:uncharacterized protein YnzC (UPF0291/DUF896 family)